jgi:hydrogenase-4 membrane subunit HyfE
MKTIVLSGLFLAFISLVIYLTSIIAVHGIRKSISDSNYFLEKPFRLVFELVMWTCGLAIIQTGLLIRPSIEWLVVSGGTGIFLVGVFSDFKRNRFFRFAHYVSAIGGFVLLGLSFWIDFGYLEYTILVALSAAVSGIFAKKRLWCLELTMAAEVFAGFFFLAHRLM